MFKRTYGEASGFSDGLIWEARNDVFRRFYDQSLSYPNSNDFKCVRGCWDGGVSEEGSARGHCMEIAHVAGLWRVVMAES